MLHSLSVFVSVSKHNRAVGTEFLSSGSPQGLSSPMLVVIFLSCHCSLLCSPSFLIILSAIYQTMKSERKKKWTCRFFALWLMSSFLRKNVLCVLSFCGVKKELVVCRDSPIFFFSFFSFFGGGLLLLLLLLILFLFNSQKGFQVVSKLLSWEKPKSMHFSGSCKRDVCLFDNSWKICHWMGFKKYKKCRLSYFYNWLYLCILYQWNFLYWRLKDTTKKKNLRKKKSCLAWWCGLTLTGPRVWFLAGIKEVGFWYKIF